MNAAVFAVWLLLYFNSSGQIQLVGQFWSQGACQKALEARAKYNGLELSLYDCHKLVVPEAGK